MSIFVFSAPPYQLPMAPDLFLRMFAFSSLIGLVGLIFSYKSPVLYVLLAIAVFLIILIELHINPSSFFGQDKPFEY